MAERTSTAECCLDDCPRLAGYRGRKLRGFCYAHYQVALMLGDPLAKPLRPINTGRCRIKGCERPLGKRRSNWCEVHYMRNRRTGDPETNYNAPGPTHFSFIGDRAGYRVAHTRIASARGVARSYPCVDCAQTAAHWAFEWRRVPRSEWRFADSTARSPFSHDASHYGPRCIGCASWYDLGYDRDQGRRPLPGELGYSGAHMRTRRARGSAKHNPCVDCDGTASHWSFSWRRVPEVEWLQQPLPNGTRGGPYSGTPDDYDPRCSRCASRYDLGYDDVLIVA